MTYFQKSSWSRNVKKRIPHLHKWFIDANTRDRVCLCGLVADKICAFCKTYFNTKQNNGGKKIYCSRKCANIMSNPKRIAVIKERASGKNKKLGNKKCSFCQKDFGKITKHSIRQWTFKKYCSFWCSVEAKKIKDGMTKGERYRRKKGMVKKHTPEWLERIKARTKEAMYRPDVNAKIRQPKGQMSIQARVNISNALAGKLPKNMMFGASNHDHIQRGDYENSKGTMYFRSKWEANYALFLDFLVKKNEIKNWEYEADVFIFEKIQFGTRSYRPDFKVFNLDESFEYHEVKGYMDGKSKTKLRRMAKYYPEVKIILVDSDYYRDLRKKMGKILNFY